MTSLTGLVAGSGRRYAPGEDRTDILTLVFNQPPRAGSRQDAKDRGIGNLGQPLTALRPDREQRGKTRRDAAEQRENREGSPWFSQFLCASA